MRTTFPSRRLDIIPGTLDLVGPMYLFLSRMFFMVRLILPTVFSWKSSAIIMAVPSGVKMSSSQVSS